MDTKSTPALSNYQRLQASAAKGMATRAQKQIEKEAQQKPSPQPYWTDHPNVRMRGPWGMRKPVPGDTRMANERSEMLTAKDPVVRISAIMADHAYSADARTARLMIPGTTGSREGSGGELGYWHELADNARLMALRHLDNGHSGAMGPEIGLAMRKASLKMDLHVERDGVRPVPFADVLTQNTKWIETQVQRSLSVGPRAEQDISNQASMMGPTITVARRRMADIDAMGVPSAVPPPLDHVAVTITAVRAHLATEAALARSGHLDADRIVARAIDPIAIAARSRDDAQYEGIPFHRPNIAAASRRTPEERLLAVESHRSSPKEPLPEAYRAAPAAGHDMTTRQSTDTSRRKMEPDSSRRKMEQPVRYAGGTFEQMWGTDIF